MMHLKVILTLDTARDVRHCINALWWNGNSTIRAKP